MDRLAIANRTRQVLGNQLAELPQMIQQDRERLGRPDEPAIMSSTLRGYLAEMSDVGLLFHESSGNLARTALAAPEQQQEAIGHLLDAGASALERLAHEDNPELSDEQIGGLEMAWLLYMRPPLTVNQKGQMERPPMFWNALEEERPAIEQVQRSVAQIELLGHPEYDWAGTGFLVGDRCLMTTRQTIEVLAERTEAEQWHFRPGISAWIDFQIEGHVPTAAACRVLSILGCHQRYDLGFLEIESPPESLVGPIAPLWLNTQPQACGAGRPVYMIGFPIRDSRRNEPEHLARMFHRCYNVKAIQPGRLCERLQFGDVQLLQHDCAMLGRSRGSCIVDLESHLVLGMHLTGRYLENGTAIPLWALRDDPLLRQCGVHFASQPAADELTRLTRKLDRLSRTPFWEETCRTIETLCRKAFV